MKKLNTIANFNDKIQAIEENTNPHQVKKIDFNNVNPDDEEIIFIQKLPLKKPTTPPKRQSILAMVAFKDAPAIENNTVNKATKGKQFKFKPTLELDLNAEKIEDPTKSNMIVNEDNINEIFDKEY